MKNQTTPEQKNCATPSNTLLRLNQSIDSDLFFDHRYHCAPKTRFSEPQYSETLNLMNKFLLPFSYFTLYPDSIQ